MLTQLIKKCPVYYKARRIIILFTTVRDWTLPVLRKSSLSNFESCFTTSVLFALFINNNNNNRKLLSRSQHPRFAFRRSWIQTWPRKQPVLTESLLGLWRKISNQATTTSCRIYSNLFSYHSTLYNPRYGQFR